MPLQKAHLTRLGARVQSFNARFYFMCVCVCVCVCSVLKLRAPNSKFWALEVKSCKFLSLMPHRANSCYCIINASGSYQSVSFFMLEYGRQSFRQLHRLDVIFRSSDNLIRISLVPLLPRAATMFIVVKGPNFVIESKAITAIGCHLSFGSFFISDKDLIDWIKIEASLQGLACFFTTWVPLITGRKKKRESFLSHQMMKMRVWLRNAKMPWANLGHDCCSRVSLPTKTFCFQTFRELWVSSSIYSIIAGIAWRERYYRGFSGRFKTPFKFTRR